MDGHIEYSSERTVVHSKYTSKGSKQREPTSLHNQCSYGTKAKRKLPYSWMAARLSNQRTDIDRKPQRPRRSKSLDTINLASPYIAQRDLPYYINPSQQRRYTL